MKKRMLIALVLFCGLLFTASSNATAQNVPINLTCYPGFYIWDISFNDNAGGFYSFTSTADIEDNHYLGSIPPGKYTIEFSSNYGWQRYFDFGIDSPGYYHWHFGENYTTIYDVIIDGETWIIIEPR